MYNSDRATTIERFITKEFNNESVEQDAIDALTNLMHLLHHEEIDFNKCLKIALLHYNKEIIDDA